MGASTAVLSLSLGGQLFLKVPCPVSTSTRTQACTRPASLSAVTSVPGGSRFLCSLQSECISDHRLQVRSTGPTSWRNMGICSSSRAQVCGTFPPAGAPRVRNRRGPGHGGGRGGAPGDLHLTLSALKKLEELKGGWGKFLFF